MIFNRLSSFKMTLKKKCNAFIDVHERQTSEPYYKRKAETFFFLANRKGGDARKTKRQPPTQNYILVRTECPHKYRITRQVCPCEDIFI